MRVCIRFLRGPARVCIKGLDRAFRRLLVSEGQKGLTVLFLACGHKGLTVFAGACGSVEYVALRGAGFVFGFRASGVFVSRPGG